MAAPRARYKVEVGWDQSPLGLFTFGVSQFGGSDVLAASAWSETFAGAYDNITAPGDRTHVDRVSITRGRDDIVSAMQGGTLTLDVTDPIAKFNRKNAASPLYGKILPLRPCRVSYTYTSPSVGAIAGKLFYGFLDRCDWTPSGRSGSAQLTFIDFFAWLDQALLVLELGPTTTGGAIGAILDTLRWTDPAMRSLDVGDSIPGINADGTQSALSVIQDLLLAERGVFFVSAAGVVTFKSRNREALSSSVGTVVNKMSGLSTGVDRTRIKNRFTVTPRVGGARTYDDLDSQRKFGFYADQLASAYVADAEHAYQLAAYVVQQGRNPETPLWDVSLRNSDDALLVQMLQRELTDRVTLTEAQGGTSADFIVEQINHTIQLGGLAHDVGWRCSEAPTTRPFVFGTSQFGGSDTLGY